MLLPNVVSQSVHESDVVAALSSEMPDGDREYFAEFARALFEGKSSVTVGELLLNVYVNTPLALATSEGGVCDR